MEKLAVEVMEFEIEELDSKINWLQKINHFIEGRIKLLMILFYRSGTVNAKSFVGKVLLRIKRKFELN